MNHGSILITIWRYKFNIPPALEWMDFTLTVQNYHKYPGNVHRYRERYDKRVCPATPGPSLDDSTEINSIRLDTSF